MAGDALHLNDGFKSMTMDGAFSGETTDVRGGGRRYRLPALVHRTARLRPRHRRPGADVPGHAHRPDPKSVVSAKWLVRADAVEGLHHTSST